MLGFWFSKHDLELLDDPIPDSLYCRPCRQKHTPLDLEGNNNAASVDTLSSTAQNSSEQDIVVTSEPTPHHRVSCTNALHRESFNITTEVDRCDLWKNVVKTLDKSPEVARPSNEEVATEGVTTATDGGWGHGERAWHPTLTVEASRTLCTLEECENEADSPVFPDYDEVSSPKQQGLGVASPLYQGRFHPSAPHEPSYQSTAV